MSHKKKRHADLENIIAIQNLRLTDKNFHVIIQHSTKPGFVDFWALWCGPCRAINPIISELASELEDYVTIGKVNVNQQPQLSAEFHIQYIPTFLFFQQRQVQETLIESVPKQVLVEKILSRSHTTRP